MGGWRPGRTISAVVASIVLSSCTGVKPVVEHEPDSKTFADAATSAQDPVTTAIEREAVRPGEEHRAPREGETLQPGEAIWVPTGKSRVLQLRNPLKRVSIGDPSV